MKLALIILCLVLAGCQGRQNPGRYKKTKEDQKWMPSIPANPAHENYAQGASVVPSGIPVTLTWDSPSPHFKVYVSPDRSRWAVGYIVQTNYVTVLAQPPQWYYVTAIEGSLESEPSNKLLIVGKTNAITVTGEHAATPDGPWQAYAVPVFSGPTSGDMQVFRLKAETKSAWQTIIEP